MSQNFARYLSRNEGSENPSNIVFVDTESYQTRDDKWDDRLHLTLRLWCAIRVRIEGDLITRRKTAQGIDYHAFWDWLLSVSDEHRCTWVFAHNLGFDLTQLHFWEKLDDGTFTTKPLYRNTQDRNGKKQASWQGKMCLEHNPAFVVVRNGRRTFKFVDTCNYWPKSLDTIGRNVGIRKHTMPDVNRPDREWFDYCMQDVRVLEAAVCGLIGRWRKEQCGVFQVTAASLAMTNFRHTCNVRVSDNGPVDIVCNPGGKEHELERQAYYGGRIGCYFVGERHGRIYHLDVNSLYPFVMQIRSFPRRFVGYEYNTSVDDLISRMRIYDVVAMVSIRSRFDTYPVRVDREQYHCVGNYWTAICGPELARAVNSGHIDKVHCVQFYSSAPLFKGWVDYWYKRKLEAIDRGESGRGELEFCKLILNSLSGKWAQRAKKWVDQPSKIPLMRWGGWCDIDEDTEDYREYRGIGGCQQVLEDGEEPPHSFPLISAYITAYGREYMRDAINLCPAGSVLYQATDSLICTEEAYEALNAEYLIDDKRLGMFRVVGVADSCTINGPNWYVFGGVETSTGLRGKAIAAKNRGGKVQMFEQLPGIIARGPVSDVVVTERKIPRIHPVFRGEIAEDGYWQPYRISENPDFTDRPPKLGYQFDDSWDTEADRIRPLV